jgi:hypothetical protein
MLQILISLGILLLWALTSLLSRETQPLPPRPQRSRPLDGLRPPPEMSSEAEARPTRTLTSAIVSITPPAAPARGSRSTTRRGSRGRPTSTPSTAKPAEAGLRRRLTSQINQSMALAANRPLEIAPLDIPLSSLSSTLTPLSARGSGGEPRSFRAVAPTLNATAAREMLGSPEKLRELTILAEILKPPLALRSRRRSR